MRTRAAIVAAWATLAAANFALAGTAFTYQGRLDDNGQPANGTYDFEFRVGDSPVGGLQIGSAVTVGDVVVTDGLFTVQLDFGMTPFNGADRWLNVGVRAGNSVGAYTSLAPRQQFTVTPYALYAMNTYWAANGNNISNTNSGFVGIGRSSAATGSEIFGLQYNNAGYGGMYIQSSSASGTPFYGYRTGNGTATMWTYYDGDTDSWYVYNGGDRLTVDGNGNVGIGDTTPDARLDVATADGHAIVASTTAASSYGVSGSGTTAGVYGVSGASNGSGVLGVDNTSSGTGVQGESSGNGGAGVVGYGNNGTGVYGQSFNGYGVYGTNGGSNTGSYAGYFNGRVHVAGTLSKSGGSFKIDHPLDPANKFLSHSFVESPEMMNIYNGIATLDANGAADVVLPDWFEALNKEFRYQLTAIGAPAPGLYVAQEVRDNVFAIAGGQPGMRVSWQVTGIRHDAWADQNRIPVEEVKSPTERGKYLTPEAFGLDRSLAIHPDRPVTVQPAPQTAPQDDAAQADVK